MNPLQERLHSFLHNMGISVRAFERQCDIKAGTVSKMTERSYGTTFHKIATAYPQLNIDWLKNGDGEMLKPMAHESYQVGVGIGKQQGGKSEFKIDISESDSAEEAKAEEEVCNLKREIEHLKLNLAEKDARIEELKASLERERKMNDYLMGQK